MSQPARRVYRGVPGPFDVAGALAPFVIAAVFVVFLWPVIVILAVLIVIALVACGVSALLTTYRQHRSRRAMMSTTEPTKEAL